MNGHRINQYRLSWNVDTQRGSITLLEVNHQAEFVVENLNGSDFLALSTMLRYDRPIYYDDVTRTIRTANELVGKEELD